MKFFKKALPFLILLLTVAGFFLPTYQAIDEDQLVKSGDEIIEGTVTSILEEKTIETIDSTDKYQKLAVSIYDGSLEGNTIITENSTKGLTKKTLYEEGDKVVLAYHQDETTGDQFFIIDYVRRPILLWIFAVFVAIAIITSGMQGFSALIGMAFSFLVIFKIILPMLLAGQNPILTAIVGSAIIIPVSFYISHGFNRKTTVAIAGTIMSLVVTGIIGNLFIHLGRLSGMSSDEALFLSGDLGINIDFQGLILAGIIVSILGILDDITVAQSAIVQELKNSKKEMSVWETFTRAMRVGKDHIASMINTLVLVFTGASLPLLMLFIDHSHTFNEVLNYDFIAEEIIFTLTGSISLILAVPTTTLLACLNLKHNDK